MTSVKARAAFGDLLPHEVRRLDAAAAAMGVDTTHLIEVAGWQLARCVWAVASQRPARIQVIAGYGNNGGDGLSAARHLASWGCEVRVALVKRSTPPRGETAVQLAILERAGVVIDSGLRVDCDIAVDAVLGVGPTEAPRQPEADLIRAMAGMPIVVSVDVPSGMDASTGVGFDPSVRATVTCTMAGMKRGLWLAAPEQVGRIVIAPINIPTSAWSAAGLSWPTALVGGDLVWLETRHGESVERRDASSASA